jgi:hypothetical protein
MKRRVIFSSIVLVLLFSVVMIAGCTGDPPKEPSVIFELMFEEIESREEGGVTVWDALIIIDGIYPYEDGIPWTSLILYLRKGGDDLTSRLPPIKYEDSPSRPDEVVIWYDDASGDPTTADPMDYIFVTGMTEEYQGAEIALRYDHAHSGMASIPRDFTPE